VAIGFDHLQLNPLTWIFVIGAWSSIAASETDVNSPLNQTLFDKIRADLYVLAAMHHTLLNQFGQRWTGAEWVKLYPDAVRYIPDRDTWYELAKDMFLFIPINACKIWAHIRLETTVTAGTYIRFKIGDYYSDPYALDELGPWTYDVPIEGFLDEWRNFSIEVMRGNMGIRRVTMSGLIVTAILYED
jgi:hypothetical protein